MLNFKKAGSGKRTIVLLHGWGGSWQSWAPIIDKLKAKFIVFALDLPGFGLSVLSRPYSLHDYVAEISGFLAKQTIKRPIIIGHSFGGQVALKLALNEPKNIRGLILVNAAATRDNSLRIRSKIAISKYGKRFLESARLGKFTPTISRLYYRFGGLKDSDYFHTRYDPNLQKTLGKIMREDLTAEFHRISLPTLIFWGEKDPSEFTPLKYAYLLNKEIKHSKLVVIPNVGHFSYLEAPDRFVQEVTDFIKNL